MVDLRSQRGFTIIEMVVTTVFVAVVSVAIVEIFITINRMDKEARNTAIVTALAEQKIESYRNAGFAAIPTGSPAETFTSSLPANLGSPKSAVTDVTSVQGGLEQVDVIISYHDDNVPKTVHLTTLVAQRGIDQ